MDCVILLIPRKIKFGDGKRSPWLPKMTVYSDTDTDHRGVVDGETRSDGYLPKLTE